MKQKLFYSLFFLVTFIGLNAQGFDLNLTATPETCYGSNGAISITTENTTAGATLEYVLYKLPENTIPYSFGMGDAGDSFVFSGLISGDYKVAVTQLVGSTSLGTEEEIITISFLINSVTPQTTEIMSSIVCDTGTITVMLFQGVAEYYQLLVEQPVGSGTFVEVGGPQGDGEDTTVFMGIVPGNYRILIKDENCGNEVIITHFVPEPMFEVFLSGALFCEGEAMISLNAFGVPPFTYQLVDTDGNGNMVVVTDNGENNIFLNIEPEIFYMFRVIDGCGNEMIIETIFDEPINGDMFFNSQEMIDNFSNLDCTTITGDLTISGSNITDLGGLNSITHINGNLIIIDCPLLTNLDDFINLVSIGGTFSEGKLFDIQDNNGGILHIENNSLLNDISGLVNIDPNTIGELIIVDNPSVTVCSLTNLCTYLSDEDNLRTIENNAGNCIDEQSTMLVCSTMSVNDEELYTIKFYPNPVKDALYFSREVQKVTLTDLTGKVLMVENNSQQIDMESLPKGMYLVVLEHENQLKETNKIIKQ